MTSIRGEDNSSVSKYRARLSVHFDGLEQAYLERRVADTASAFLFLLPPCRSSLRQPSQSSTSVYWIKLVADVGTGDDTVDDSRRNDLEHFSEVVHSMSQYGDFRRLATLNYNVDTGPSLSIVSRYYYIVASRCAYSYIVDLQHRI